MLFSLEKLKDGKLEEKSAIFTRTTLKPPEVITHTERIETLYRVMKKLGMLSQKPKKEKRIVKPYEQMTFAGERKQVDVKVVPKKCIADKEMKLY